jgi:NADPH:quinone reductase-like Zn-dependent oxidoreductase
LAVAKDGARVAGIPAPVRPTGEGNVLTTSILVTGGTGTLGRPVTQRLRDAGASVTVLSRSGDWGNRQPQRRDDRRLTMCP